MIRRSELAGCVAFSTISTLMAVLGDSAKPIPSFEHPVRSTTVFNLDIVKDDELDQLKEIFYHGSKSRLVLYSCTLLSPSPIVCPAC